MSEKRGWTEGEEKRLRELCASGISERKIADIMKRKYSTVRSRICVKGYAALKPNKPKLPYRKPQPPKKRLIPYAGSVGGRNEW